jgi:hypothetical protein
MARSRQLKAIVAVYFEFFNLRHRIQLVIGWSQLVPGRWACRMFSRGIQKRWQVINHNQIELKKRIFYPGTLSLWYFNSIGKKNYFYSAFAVLTPSSRLRPGSPAPAPASRG